MTFKELKQISRPHYYCIFLDKFFPRFLRDILRNGSAIAALISFGLSFDNMPLYLGFADGLFFLFVFIYLTLAFLEFFYRSMASEGLQNRIDENFIDKNKKIDYTLSSIVFATDEIDITRALFETKIGSQILIKAGVLPQDFKDFVSSKRASIIASAIDFGKGFIDLTTYVSIVYDTDKSLQVFLSQNYVNREKFISSANQIMEIEDKKRHEERFWGRENLKEIPSVMWLCGF